MIEKDVEIDALRIHASSVEYTLANSLADAGEIDKALRLYTDALRQRIALANKANLQDDALVDVRFLSHFCRWGVLWGRAEQVLMACNQAVDAASTSGQEITTRDGRGLARALTGDLEGARQDFEDAVQWAQESGYDEAFIESRTAWIAALQAGKNPFDAATLEQLR